MTEPKASTELERPPVITPRRTPRVLAHFAGILLIFFSVEGLIFRSGLYSSVLEPGSTAGQLMVTLRNEMQREIRDPNQVVTVGDSRMALRARIANESSASGGYTFATIAVPGTSPRCWYYMLREVDPGAKRYAAVIIPVNEYEDDDWEDMANRIVDLHYLVPLLRYRDVIEFSGSFPTWRNRWEAFRGSVLKGWSYRRDFQEFLVQPGKRLADVEWERENSAQAIYTYQWPDHGVKGLSVDWATQTIRYPDGTTPPQQEVFRRVLLRGEAPPTGKRALYRRKWFGKIVEYYRGSRTKVIFMRLPRGPVVRPQPSGPKTSVAREFGRRGEAVLMDEHLCDEVERPELFIDPLHMNGPGAAKFTLRLAAAVRGILGAPAAAHP